MKAIDEQIMKNMNNSKKLREIYLGEYKLSFEKSKELQKMQDVAYKKMVFFKKLKKELMK